MIFCIRLDETTACMAIEGATDTESSAPRCESCSVQRFKRGDMVVMDNLAAHKNEGSIALTEAVGLQPSFPPDLNPIEKMWSKVMPLLRNAEVRTHEDLIKAIASSLGRIITQDAINYFASSGYSFI